MRILQTIRQFKEVEPWQTAEEMEERCCFPKEEILCQEVSYKWWEGYDSAEIIEKLNLNLDADGKDEAGHLVIIKKEVRKSPCGKLTRRMEDTSENCCEGVFALAWDYDNSAATIGADDSATVWVEGGKTPITWRTVGNGFWTNSARTSKTITTGKSLIVFTDDDACGSCTIIANDGCTEIEGTLRCTVGKWESISLADCPVRNAAADSIYSASLSTIDGGTYKLMLEAIVGKYRVRQQYFTGYNSYFAGKCSYLNETTWQNMVDNEAATYSYRAPIVLIDPKASVDNEVVSPADSDSNVANQALTAYPWAPVSGQSLSYKDEVSEYLCRSSVFTLGNRNFRETDGLAWEWVC